MRAWRETMTPSQYRNLELQIEALNDAWEKANLLSDRDSATKMTGAAIGVKDMLMVVTEEVFETPTELIKESAEKGICSCQFCELVRKGWRI